MSALPPKADIAGRHLDVRFVLSLFLMPETRQRSIWDEAATAQKA